MVEVWADVTDVRDDGAQFQRPTGAEVDRKAVLARLAVGNVQTSSLQCHPSL